MKDDSHLGALGIKLEGEVTFDRQGVADHAKNLANTVKGNLENSLIGLGVDVIEGKGVLQGAHKIKDDATGKVRDCGCANVHPRTSNLPPLTPL